MMPSSVETLVIKMENSRVQKPENKEIIWFNNGKIISENMWALVGFNFTGRTPPFVTSFVSQFWLKNERQLHH